MKEPELQTLIINGEFTDLNTYIRAERTNKYKAAKIKQQETERVMLAAKSEGMKPMTKPVCVVIRWETKNKRKDKDNIAFAKKFILDGLVKAGVLKNDGWDQVDYFIDFFKVVKDKPKTIITLTEIKQV